MHYVAVVWIGDTVMLHGFFEGVDVLCAGRQVTHELLAGPRLHITILSLFDSVKGCSAEVDHDNFIVEEEVFRYLIP